MHFLDRETMARRMTTLALHSPPHAFPLIVWEDPHVEKAVREALLRSDHGVPAYTGPEGVEALGDRAGVVVFTPSEIVDAKNRHVPWRQGQVWCVVGGGAEPEAVSWVESMVEGARSLILTPSQTQDLDGREPEWDLLRDHLERAGREPGRDANPVVVVSRPDQFAAIEGECVLRLEGAGIPRVRTIPGPSNVIRAAITGLQTGAAVVVRAEDGWTTQSQLEEAVDTLTELVRQGVQVVLLAGARLGRDIEDDPDWSGARLRASFVHLDSDAGAARAKGGAPVAWPEIVDILPGAPNLRATSSTVIARGRIGAGDADTGFSLISLVQQAANNQTTGEIALYRATQFGTLRFHQGMLVGANIMGGQWSLESMIASGDGGSESELLTRLMIDRTARMSLWPTDTEWVMRVELGDPIGSDAPRIPSGALAINVARWVDEVHHLQRTTGGWSRRWIGLPEVPDDLDLNSPVGRMWRLADGKKPLLSMALEAHLLLPDAFAAIVEAVRIGIMRPSDDDMEARLDVTDPYDVHVALLRRGLLDAAAELLARREAERPLGVWAARELGYLVAERDPAQAVALWAGLDSREQEHPKDELGLQEEIETMLARRLLESRQPESHPLALWRAAKRELEVTGAGYQWTARLAAVVAEMALRAEDWASADAAIQALRRYPEGERQGLLAPLLTAARSLGARLGDE